MQLDRNRLFALLGALEEDLRFIIEAYLLINHHEEQILGNAYEKALERFVSDEERDVTQTGVIDYLDLGDEIEILNRWRNDLPAQTREAITGQSVRLAELVPIRNRVVHRRPLHVDDFDKAKQVLTQLDKDGFGGMELKEALGHIREDPDWTPNEPIPSVGAKTLNNLPLGDYDETGLVGRARELNKLSKRLTDLSSSRRGPVLTVTGPGGVGKTALVLQALHDLVNDESCPYDLVSWVSLKTEHLTARGVQSIHDAVLSMEQAVPALIEALEPSFAGTASQLAHSLDGLTTLIVIDNLETISGHEVVEFIDSLPESVSYLFTSREGLGEIERRFPLGPLEERYAVDLLRRLTRTRDLHSFTQMDQKAAKEVVRRLGASPLGLKWFVSNLEIGKDPEEIIRHRDDLVRFCVENVFDSLNNDAKKVANVLHILAKPVTAQEILLYLPDMTTDKLRASIQSLDQRMLVRRDLVTGSISETFEATESLSDYLRFAGIIDPEEVTRVQEADDEVRRAEERHRRDAATGSLRPNVIHGGQEHRASVILLRDALSQSKRREVEEALERLKEAESLDPEFWEIHRVRGFILSSAGRVDEATSAYLKAIQLAPTAEYAAIVKFFFAGHLTRKVRDSARAVTVAREAHEVLSVEGTAIELGRALTFVDDFESAESTLKQAINSGEVRTRLIAVTQLIDCMKRRAEAEATVDRQPDKAVATLTAAIKISDEAVEGGLVDTKLTGKVVSLVSELFSIAISCREERLTQEALSVALASLDRLGSEPRRSRSFGYLIGHAKRIMLRRPGLVADASMMSTILEEYGDNKIDNSLDLDEDDNSLLGVIKAWKPDRHFGFITTLDRKTDLFFNLASLADSSYEILLEQNTAVRFRRTIDSNDRPLARDVRIEQSDNDVLERRRLMVERMHPSGRCLFSIDLKSGATVFVGLHALVYASEWNNIQIGIELESNVEIDEEGRFSAAPGSTRIPK